MKKLCKTVDITNRELIAKATYKCLEKKYKRNDTCNLLAEITGLRKNEIYCIYKRYGRNALKGAVEALIDTVRQEIITWNIQFPKIWYKNKIDSSNQKVRRIGIENIKQQIYDHIAIEALSPLWKRIGEHQYACIKSRGPLKGAKRIKRWLKDKTIRYVGKMDIRKCYPSIDRALLMEFLSKHIKNDKLLGLVELLIYSYEQGLSIGSVLSQYLCNTYMSILYHEIKENLYKIRRKRNGSQERVYLTKHALFYADDMLILGTRKADLKTAIRKIKQKAAQMGLEIKPDFQLYEIGNGMIDMMGYKIYRAHMTIRKRVFRRARRTFKKIWKLHKTKRPIKQKDAKRCISYFGQIKNTNSRKVQRRLHVDKVVKICKGVIKNESNIPAAA